MSAAILAKRLLADAAGLDEAAIPEDARVGSFEQWESLVHMRLLLAVEEHLGRELDPDEVAGIESLAEIEALLQTTPLGKGGS